MLNALLTPIGIWHACVSTCALLELPHLASLQYFALMLLLFLELLLHSPNFCIQRFHLLVVIEDLGVGHCLEPLLEMPRNEHAAVRLAKDGPWV